MSSRQRWIASTPTTTSRTCCTTTPPDRNARPSDLRPRAAGRAPRPPPHARRMARDRGPHDDVGDDRSGRGTSPSRWPSSSPSFDVLATLIPPRPCVLPSTAPVVARSTPGCCSARCCPLRFGARIVSHEALLPRTSRRSSTREGDRSTDDQHARAPAATVADAAMPRGLRVDHERCADAGELHMSLATGHGLAGHRCPRMREGRRASRRAINPMSAWTPLPGVRVSAPTASSWWSRRGVARLGIELDDRIELRPGGGFTISAAPPSW